MEKNNKETVELLKRYSDQEETKELENEKKIWEHMRESAQVDDKDSIREEENRLSVKINKATEEEKNK